MVKLAFSNIAWSVNNDQVFEALASRGVTGIEVAPGKIAAWSDISPELMHSYRLRCERHGLCIPSFQAFLFGKPELQLLGDDEGFSAFMAHMQFVAELAQAAGAKILVFGAPKNRLKLGHSDQSARKLAIQRLAKLAGIVWQYGASIGLEAVPEAYGGDFITSYKDSLDIVAEVNHPGLVFHFDVGCTWLNGDNVAQAINDSGRRIAHFHISQPELQNFYAPGLYHSEASNALHNINYAGWLCIEMKETPEPLPSINGALDYVESVYIKKLQRA